MPKAEAAVRGEELSVAAVFAAAAVSGSCICSKDCFVLC